MKNDPLENLREGKALSLADELGLVVRLSIPAIMAQISSVLMQYIDASMVGQLGANDSASIGLMASTTWLIGGVLSSAAIGYTVQVAHRIGAGEDGKARGVVRLGLTVAFLFALCIMAVCLALSGVLPRLLGANDAIYDGAVSYFRIYAMALPVLSLVYICGGMLQASGDMRLPSILNILMCVMDVIFNALFIFPSGTISLGEGTSLPGAGLGIAGAALGTAVAEGITALLMLFFLLTRSDKLRATLPVERGDTRELFGRATRLSLPVAIEQVIIGGAYVMATKIVSPLGTIAIAANSFAITAESLCYMPGYGVEMAAVTIIGQCFGAGRKDTARRLSFIVTFFGIAVMAVAGVLMYIFAPQMLGLLTPDPDIRTLGTRVLRIEAFAEPMFAASMVATGVFRGAGDTLAPSVINLISMWFVRLPLAFFLSGTLGLTGVWIAMCIELNVRGILFLIRLYRKRFDTPASKAS